jgi:hypothetical protein
MRGFEDPTLKFMDRPFFYRVASVGQLFSLLSFNYYLLLSTPPCLRGEQEEEGGSSGRQYLSPATLGPTDRA